MRHRILYVDSTEDIYGGGQISLLELLRNLDRSKFRPVVALSEKGKLREEIEQLGGEYVIIPMPTIRPWSVSTCLGVAGKMAEFIKRNDFALIHTNTSRSTIYAGFAAKKFKIPVVWHVRIPHPDRPLDIILARWSSRIIAVSHIVKKRFSWLKQEKVTVIYNGVDTKRFCPTASRDSVREKLHLSREDIVIGTVGRLSSEKGLEFLLSATRDVVMAYPRVKVLIVGNGNKDYRLFLQEKAKSLELSSNIIFAGFRDDIPQLLGGMDIFCLPSLTEGFNRSLLEAMACGLPVVATHVGGNLEIVRDGVNGAVVPPHNPYALGSAIIELLKDREKARIMGSEGHRLVEEKFSIEKNVRLTESLYEEVISNSFEKPVLS
jgi:glycosyltransferase involved in cell wall biosynthesis